MLHVHINAAYSSPYSMGMDMQHGLGLYRSMDMDMQQRDGHAARARTCNIKMDMQHELGHAAWTRWTSTCCWSMFMSILHVYFYAACPCPFCMFILYMLRVHVRAVFPCPFVTCYIYCVDMYASIL
jgi:hypothetical protein